MKRIMTILIVASLFGGVAFAQGASELDSTGIGNGPGNFGRDAYAQGNFGRGGALNSRDMYGQGLNGQGTFGRGVNLAQGLASTDGEPIETSGTIQEIDDYYVLETAEGTYSLSAPGFPRSGAPMPVGEAVQVSGLLLPTAVEDCPLDAEGHIIIETAAFDGEEFVFAAGPAGGQNRSGRQYAGRAKGTAGRRR
ncbi:MAG: hypothetical protein P1P77_01080 [Spirochaetaceae bacterium]|nr:hypothetical protein [Spirochaetaceae bacterium]